MIITAGFADGERPEVARLYWEAFGGKLGRTLGPTPQALRFIAISLSPDHAVCARDGQGRLLGVAGFKTPDGALVGGTFRDMMRVYGLIGAAWRSGLLSLLVRDVENRRFLMDGLFVAPEARGQGVGSGLLEAIVAEAARRGYAEVRLDVIDSNPRARALYERCGFAAVGTQPMGWLGPLFGFRSATTMVRRVG